MSDVVLDDLYRNLQIFANGEDRSLNQANKIEGMLVQHFYDVVEFEDLLDKLARYSPGGGDYLYDEKMIMPPIIAALRKVEAMLNE